MNVRRYLRVGPRAGCVVALLALLVLALARVATSQVTAVAELRGSVAELFVGNPTAGPLHVTVQVFRDATPAGGAVTLGDPVTALVTPATFTLASGEHQIVRLRVRDTVAPGDLLRVVTVLDPRPPDVAGPGARLTVVTRLITKLKVVAP
jgi:P pilus assembly chaperone PapD